MDFQQGRAWNEDGWFAPLNHALRGITAEQAAWRETLSTNSILDIVHHLVFWNEWYLQRFKQPSVPPIEISNAETFKRGGNHGGEMTWEGLQQKLDGLLTID